MKTNSQPLPLPKAAKTKRCKVRKS